MFTLEDSKTKFGRRMVIAGKTRGSLAFEAALYVKGLWKESGFAIKEEMRDGMRILRPDYFVLRVSLLGMQKAMITRFAGMLEACKEPAVAVLGKYSARKVLERGLVNETDGEEKKYVNIAGGARESDALAGALQWVQSIGLGRFANVVPGPLLRATDGKKITHMPLQTGSAYAHLSKAMEKAYFTSRARGVVDQELDLGSHDPRTNPRSDTTGPDVRQTKWQGTQGMLPRPQRRRSTRHLDGIRSRRRESSSSIMQARRRY